MLQDTRGRFQSEGVVRPFVDEGHDGYDSVEWVAAQPWCTGSVGMIGLSYLGFTQWAAAVEQPPHLKTILPIWTWSGTYEFIYPGGAFALGSWLNGVMIVAPNTAIRNAGGKPEAALPLLQAFDRMGDLYAHLPLGTVQPLKGRGAAPYYFDDWLGHPVYDEFWRAVAINRRHSRVRVPAFNIGGWYDLCLHGTLENYVGMRNEGGSEAARSGQRLLVGPWAHSAATGWFYPELSYSILADWAALDLTSLGLRYFDHHLKGVDNGFDREPPVRIFVMGENVWRNEQEWPLARTVYTPWYLHSRGDAIRKTGVLSAEAPWQEAPDHYLYDPRNPCPTVGGPTLLPGGSIAANAGPRDQRASEARPDVLVYTSEPLSRPLEVTGPLKVVLYAATSAPDTDFVARLCDVYPDGRSIILAEGILRARYRESYSQPSLVEPGRVYKYEIDLVATSNLFGVGHKVRVDITSSSFPRFDRNPNTGNPFGQDGPDDLRPAMQTIFHTEQYPSHVVLPVIPR